MSFYDYKKGEWKLNTKTVVWKHQVHIKLLSVINDSLLIDWKLLKGEWKIELENISMKTLNPYKNFECD